MYYEGSQQDRHETRAIDHLLQLLSHRRREQRTPNHEPVVQRGVHRSWLCLSEQRMGCVWSAQGRTVCGEVRGLHGFKVHHLSTTAGGSSWSSAGWQKAMPLCTFASLPDTPIHNGRTQWMVLSAPVANPVVSGTPEGTYTGVRDGALHRFSTIYNAYVPQSGMTHTTSPHGSRSRSWPEMFGEGCVSGWARTLN